MRLAGAHSPQVVKCPACGKSLRVQPLDAKANRTDPGELPEEERSWRMRGFDGADYGPYTFDEISVYVAEQRVIATSQLRHPNATGNKWMAAGTIPAVSSLIERAPTEVPTEPGASPIQVEGPPTVPASGAKEPWTSSFAARSGAASVEAGGQRLVRVSDAPTALLPTWAAVIIALTFTILGVVTIVGSVLFAATLASAESAPQEAAAGAIFGSLFVASYLVARSIEKIVRAFCRR